MLRSRLDIIAKSLDEQLDPAMKQLAEEIASSARGRVPVDTGKLKNAIHVEKQGEGSYSVVAGDDDAFYGHIIEHGGVDNPPHPFLIPAFEERKDDAPAVVRNALRDI